jgi:hypothetical protein
MWKSNGGIFHGVCGFSFSLSFSFYLSFASTVFLSFSFIGFVIVLSFSKH